MISKRTALTLAGAFVIGGWLAKTEMGAHVRASPPHETIHVVLRSLATFAEGRMPPALARTDRSERITEYRADEPIRRTAAAFGMLMIESHRGTSEWIARCTAVAIAPDTIITNFHCVPGYDASEIIDRLTLWIDYVDAHNVTKIDVNPTPIEKDEALDYAILTLKTPLNPSTHVLPSIRFRAAMPGESLLLVHHSRGEVKSVTRHRCRVATSQDHVKDRLAHSCDAASGSSGALLLAERDHAIVGLHRSITKDDRPYVGYATPAMALLAKSPTLQALSRQAAR